MLKCQARSGAPRRVCDDGLSMWEWFRAAYDKQDVSLYRVLPVSDEGQFMRFVCPLRMRAALFFSLLLIAYEIVNALLATVGQGRGY